MSETATDNEMPAGQSDQGGQTASGNDEANGLEIMYESTESPAEVGAHEGETAREVAARHLGRLLYTPVNTWSRYVFHENEPHPFAPARPAAGRG